MAVEKIKMYARSPIACIVGFDINIGCSKSSLPPNGSNMMAVNRNNHRITVTGEYFCDTL